MLSNSTNTTLNSQTSSSNTPTTKKRKKEEQKRKTSKSHHQKLSYCTSLVPDTIANILKPLQDSYLEIINKTNSNYYAMVGTLCICSYFIANQKLSTTSDIENRQVAATSLMEVTKFFNDNEQIQNFKSFCNEQDVKQFELIIDEIIINCCRAYKNNKKKNLKRKKDKTRDSSKKFAVEEEDETYEKNNTYDAYRAKLCQPIKSKKLKIDTTMAIDMSNFRV